MHAGAAVGTSVGLRAGGGGVGISGGVSSESTGLPLVNGLLVALRLCVASAQPLLTSAMHAAHAPAPGTDAAAARASLRRWWGAH